jgi:competence transcription factor ComK
MKILEPYIPNHLPTKAVISWINILHHFGEYSDITFSYTNVTHKNDFATIYFHNLHIFHNLFLSNKFYWEKKNAPSIQDVY